MEWLKKLITSKYVGSVVRTGLAGVAGLLISIGLPPEIVEPFKQYSEPVITGIIMLIATQGWSLFDKKKRP